jgi:hypothetical protein
MLFFLWEKSRKMGKEMLPLFEKAACSPGRRSLTGIAVPQGRYNGC